MLYRFIPSEYIKIIIKASPNFLIIIKITCMWSCSSTCTIESNYVYSGGRTSKLMSKRWTFLPVT